MKVAAPLAVIVALSPVGACTSDGVAPEESTSTPPVSQSEDEPQNASTTSPTTTSVPPVTTSTIVVSPSSTFATTAPDTVDEEPEAAITRPVFASDVCLSTSSSEGETIDGVTFFTLVSDEPIPVQIVAEPGTTPADPFAVLERLPGSGFELRGDVVDINGAQVGIKTFDNGNGEAIWTLDDDTWGYLRSRGLTSDDLAAIVASLVPLPLDSPFPGFTVGGGETTPRFESLHEQLNTEIAGRVYASECVVPDTGFRYRVSAVRGDPILRYGGVIDRPVPLEVGSRNDTVIVLDGVADAAAPRIADLVDAEPEVWADLLRRPSTQTEDSVKRNAPIGGDQDVVVDITDISGSGIADSTLRLSLVVAEDVSSLEVDTADLVLHPDAEFKVLTIDGRPRSKTTASVGPTFGTRISDTASPDPFIVSITITDATDNVLQVSEIVRLVPQPA